MSVIIKTKGIVLKKLKYGDTSTIVTFFTEDFGKLSALKKGARSAKSSSGNLLDILNLVEIVVYKKESREIQLVTQVSLIKHFRNISEDIEKFKFALSIIELLEHFVREEETNSILFRGTVRILELLNQKNSLPFFLFVKYFIFFMKEIGYEINLNSCSVCGRKIEYEPVGYNYDVGAVCKDCSKNNVISFEFDEQFSSLFNELKVRNYKVSFTETQLKSIMKFLERFLIYHHPEFKGLRSLNIY